MYSAIDQSTSIYIQQFSEEAERLWSIEKASDSILNMISAQVLSLSYMGYGKDHCVLTFQVESVRMGERLGLFGVDEQTASKMFSKLPEGILQDYAFAAWGVFNWSM
jgi:hypothetical protein